MEKQDASTFLESLKRALDFSLDQPIRKGTHPDANDYFASLHVPFPKQDNEFLEKLHANLDGFLVVSAPTGRGKTSIIRMALLSLPKKARFFLFDFKNEIEKLYDFPQEPGGRHKYLRDLLKRELASQFLTEIDHKLRFIFNALYDFFFEERMHKLIFKWRAKHDNPHIGANREDLFKLFLDDLDVTPAEEEFVMERLTCAQMIACIKATLKIEHFLLVLDNVDRLNGDMQPVLFSVAIDIFHGGNGDFGLLVAVREKNLLRFELSTYGGEIIEVVSLVTHAAERSKPVRLSPPDAEFIGNLLEMRYIFAERALPATGSAVGIVFGHIKPKVRARFVEEKLHNLANHNLRNMLTLNYEFIEYLLKLVDKRVIVNERNALTIDDHDFASYLYRWMYSVANQRHEMLLDITDRYDQVVRGTIQDPIECDIELILLAWLTNSPNRFLRVNDIVEDFSHIGVRRDLVTRSLQRLYDVPLDFRHVEIGDSEVNVSWEAIDKRNPRVFITPLGREFVGSTITKFEFLFHCLTYPNVVDTDSPQMLAPVSRDMTKKVSVILTFLEKMKGVHSAAVNQIKMHTSKEGQDWEELYRERFCINQELILERIVYSHLAHLGNTEYLTRYKQLLESYLNEIGSKRRFVWPG